jgi:hypothetical protein
MNPAPASCSEGHEPAIAPALPSSPCAFAPGGWGWLLLTRPYPADYLALEPLPRGSEKVNEFRRYRQLLTALYLGTVSVGFLLLAASVVKELFFRPVVQLHGPVLSAENPDSESLLRCNDEVTSLYEDLDQTTLRLIASPSQRQRTDIIAQWEEFSRSWLRRWDRVDAWCRFSELKDTRMGEGYDRMARIHGDLPAMRLKYQSLLVRFDEEQAAELARMRRSLASSRELLRRAQGASDEEAP